MSKDKITDLTPLLAAALTTGGMIEVALGGVSYQLDLKSMFGNYTFDGDDFKNGINDVINIVGSNMEIGAGFDAVLVNGLQADNGATGSFTSVDGKTITVTAGIITAIV